MEKAAPTGNNRWAMMQRLQEIGLSLADLTEYLDTHMHDTFAMERHRLAEQEYQQLQDRYQQLFGPLNLACPNGDHDKWQWASQDFPWDYEL